CPMTSIQQIATLATFGAVWAVLSVGHNLADHVIGQTDHQAAGQGGAVGGRGRRRREPAAGMGHVSGTPPFCRASRRTSGGRCPYACRGQCLCSGPLRCTTRDADGGGSMWRRSRGPPALPQKTRWVLRRRRGIFPRNRGEGKPVWT